MSNNPDMNVQIKSIVANVNTKLLDYLKKEVDSTITGIHFEYGHYLDIQERLGAYSKVGKNVYPLVALFEDYRIAHNKLGFAGTTNMKILILWLSKAEYTREQRDEFSFNNVLLPIYYELLRQIKLSGYYNVYDESGIRHDQINRPHWGDPKLYKNDGYLLNAVLDGIEMANLQLETYLETC